MFGWRLLLFCILTFSTVSRGYASPWGTSDCAGELENARDPSDAINRFTLSNFLELYRRAPESQFGISGLALSQSLGALSMAAADVERHALWGLMHEAFDRNWEDWLEARALLSLRIGSDDGYVHSNFYNGIWPNHASEAFTNDWKELVGEYFGTQATLQPFSSKDLAPHLDAWFSEWGYGGHSVAAERFSPSPRIVIGSIHQYRAAWTDALDPERTRMETFKISDSEVIQVPMMVHEGAFESLETAMMSSVRLPHGSSGRYRFYATLFEKPGDAVLWLDQMRGDSSRFNEWLRQFTWHQGTVALPRFKLRYFEPEYQKILNSIGLRATGLPLERVLVETQVDIDETGVNDPAPAFRPSVDRHAPSSETQLGYSFRADRPFVFFVYDDTTRTIVHIGWIRDPRPPREPELLVAMSEETEASRNRRRKKQRAGPEVTAASIPAIKLELIRPLRYRPRP